MVRKIITSLFKFRNPTVQEAIRRNLCMRFHRYALVDFLLNLVTPLKLYAPPRAIVGISRLKLRFSYRGCLRVTPDNVVRFIMPQRPSFRDQMKVDVDIRGRGNVLTVRGLMHSLPACLRMSGLKNIIEIGSNFHCEDPNLLWIVEGEGHLIRIGNDVKFKPDMLHRAGDQYIALTGKNCSVEIGDESNVMLLMGAEYGTDRDFHFRLGPNSGVARLWVGMASACNLTIGHHFFCSWDCNFWCGAHAIVDAEGGVINDCKHINIGDNVWFGHGVEVPGEIDIADGCIVGSGVVLTTNVPKPKSIVASAPAKIYPVRAKWVRESPVMVQHGLAWKRS